MVASSSPHRDQAELGREGFVDASRLSLEAHLFPDDFIPEGRAHIVVAEFLQAWHGEDERHLDSHSPTRQRAPFDGRDDSNLSS